MKYSMKIHQLFAIFILFMMGCSSPQSTYYVNSQSGEDFNRGTREKPFKSIEKINSLQLQPGNSVFFAGGQEFAGTIKLSGLTGTKEKSIQIGSYGNGRAIINGGNANAVQADNCKWLQVKNLVVKGSGRLEGNTGSGIEFRKVQHCLIDSLEAYGFLWSGIKVVGGNDLRITHVFAHDNGFAGINVESDGQDAGGLEGAGQKSFHNLHIANCVAENNPGCPQVTDNHSGNGILVSGVTNGMIEYCEAMGNGWDMPREGNGPVGIWAYQSDSLTIQYCYSHDNFTSEKGKDGGGFDFAEGMTNSIMQHNFSANNEGPGYGLYQYKDASAWKNNIVRNNISYNDGRKNGQAGFQLWMADEMVGSMVDCQIYENTVVNCYGHAVSFEPGNYQGFSFRNNIFLLTGHSLSFVNGKHEGALFASNQAWSSNRKTPLAFPEDKLGILTDPNISLPEDETDLPKGVQGVAKMNFFKPRGN